VHRAITGLRAAALLLGGLLTLTPSAAQAYTCSAPHSGTVVSSVSKVSYNFYGTCSDHNIHITGTVYDTSCDNRAGSASFDVYTVPNAGGTFFDYERTAKADNGCGTNGTFNLSGPSAIQGAGETWEAAVCVYAKNSTSSSTYTCTDIYE
jgi:hypothetical protein